MTYQVEIYIRDVCNYDNARYALKYDNIGNIYLNIYLMESTQRLNVTRTNAKIFHAIYDSIAFAIIFHVSKSEAKIKLPSICTGLYSEPSSIAL